MTEIPNLVAVIGQGLPFIAYKALPYSSTTPLEAEAFELETDTLKFYVSRNAADPACPPLTKSVQEVLA